MERPDEPVQLRRMLLCWSLACQRRPQLTRIPFYQELGGKVDSGQFPICQRLANWRKKTRFVS
jgi:hypothetical protein